jgi:hypothetical protein
MKPILFFYTPSYHIKMVDTTITIVFISDANEFLMYMYNNHPDWERLCIIDKTKVEYHQILKSKSDVDSLKPINDKYSLSSDNKVYCRTDDVFITLSDKSKIRVGPHIVNMCTDSLYKYMCNVRDAEFCCLVLTHDSVRPYISELKKNKIITELLEVPRNLIFTYY